MLQTLANWLKRRRESAELDALDSDQRASVARDLGVSAAELDFLVRKSHDPLQLPQMLAALGVDEAALQRAKPAMMRDMLRVCSLCESVDACKFALDRGIVDVAYSHFCPNAETIKTIPRRRPRESTRSSL